MIPWFSVSSLSVVLQDIVPKMKFRITWCLLDFVLTLSFIIPLATLLPMFALAIPCFYPRPPLLMELPQPMANASRTTSGVPIAMHKVIALSPWLANPVAVLASASLDFSLNSLVRLEVLVVSVQLSPLGPSNDFTIKIWLESLPLSSTKLQFQLALPHSLNLEFFPLQPLLLKGIAFQAGLV